MPRNPNDISRKLRFGPYTPPRVSVGEEIICELRGKVEVGEWSDRPGIMWPRARTGTKFAMILCGDLIRAIRQEAQAAVGAHWGISPQTVSNWRRALKIADPNPGTSASLSEQAVAALTGREALPQVKAALLRAAKRQKTPEWERRMQPKRLAGKAVKSLAKPPAQGDNPDRRARRARIIEMYTGIHGYSPMLIREIAAAEGVTCQRVQHILARYVPRRERGREAKPRPPKPETIRTRAAKRRAKMIEMAGAGQTIREIANVLGMAYHSVWQVITNMRKAGVEIEPAHDSAARWMKGRRHHAK